MKSNIELVNYLCKNGIIKSKNIINSFHNTDRINFVTDDAKHFAYVDCPLPIGYGQTISQPSTVGFMLELLNPKKGEHILDIGSGSGWTTALLGNIVGEKGTVLGLERISELVKFGTKNIKKYKFNNVNIEKAGSFLGKIGKKFDKILVSASVNTLPNELVEQLVTGGIMVIPIINSIYKIKKISEKKYSLKEYPNFVFVPLIT